jgi:hypothetical protein
VRPKRPIFEEGDRVCSEQLFVKHAIVDKVVFIDGAWRIFIYEDIYDRERGLLLYDRDGFLQYDPLYQLAKVMCE